MLHSVRSENRKVSNLGRQVDSNQHPSIRPGDAWSSLQRTRGNQAILRILHRTPPTIQSKLAVNQPGDVYEQEADRVADQVMRMSAPVSVQRQCPACAQEEKLQRKCDHCEEEDKKIQRKATGSNPETAPPIVHEVLSSPGQPLDDSTRAFFEPRFGRDFSQVRLHHGSQAAESARAVGAAAYTVGSNIVFGANQFGPATHAGKKILAHELTHVIQQGTTRGPVSTLQRDVSVDDCDATQEATIRDSHSRAMEMVQNAIDKLGAYDGTNPPEVRTALDTHFHSTGTAFAGWVRLNLRLLKALAGSPQYECQAVQIGGRRGMSWWCVPFTDIQLYPIWFADPDRDMRARTMIHEWVHHYGCNFDLGYRSDEGYSGHSTARSLFNADPWAWFCVDVR